MSYGTTSCGGGCTIKCKLAGAEVPVPMRQYYTFEQYKRLIGPLREYVYNLEYGKLRAKGARAYAKFSTLLAAPFAIGVGIATLGVGFPIAILGGVAAGGAFAGAIHPDDAITARREIWALVETINMQTRPMGFYMKNPLETNNIGFTQSPKDIVDIEWVFL